MDDEEWNSVPGKRPEFGAIFMSNSATKKESLRRGVFALQSSMSHFVEQVKTGMILFLFDSERKELHGVFQATCDGAMNILPCEFSSLGRQFPAQIKFTPLWYCHPLSENEFRDAIRENYFSKYKFHFGLSKNQVERLLSLFSLRKLKYQKSQRRFMDRNSTRKNSRVADDDRSLITNLVPGKRDVDKNHRQVILPQHQRGPFCGADRATGDQRFGMYLDEGYKHKASELFRDQMGKVGCTTDADQAGIERNNGTDLRGSASGVYPLGNFGSISDSGRFAKNDRLETACYKDDDFPTTISEAYSFQSILNTLAYSNKPVLETDVHDPTRFSSSVLPLMVSYPRTSCEDPSLLYNPDVLSMNNISSSSLGFHQAHSSFEELNRHDSSAAGNILHSPKAQPFSSPLESKGASIIPDVNFGLPYSNQYEHSNQISLPRHPYPDDIAAAYSNKECSGDVSLHKPLAHVYSEMRDYVKMSEHPLSNGGSPCNHWYLNFPDRHSTLLQEKHDYQVPVCENNAEFADGAHMFKESQHHGDSFYNYNREIEDGRLAPYENMEYEHKKSQHQQQLYGHEPANQDYLTPSNPAAYQNSECLNPDNQITAVNPAACQSSENLNPDHQKKRSSVFSRLALPSKASKRERKTAPGTNAINEDSSVNEVMDMLHRSQYSWIKTRHKQPSKQHDKAANSRDRKLATKKDDLGMFEKEINLKLLPFSMVKGSKRAEEASFVDFKRRSLMRKNFEDGKTGNNHESQDDKGASASQTKRRKLIRPNLFENELPERVLSGDAPQTVVASSRECSVSKDGESIKVSASHVKEGDTMQNVESLDGIRRTAVEGNNNIDESRECSVSKDAESIKVSVRKLIRPNFFENEFPERVLSGDAPQTVIASSIECSVSKDGESMKVSASRVEEGKTLQNVELLDGIRQTAVEGNNNIDESRECSVGKDAETLQNVESLDGIRQTAVDGNNNIDESRECSVSKDAESIKVSVRKLIRPNFFENELPERVLSGDAPQTVIASSIECSVGKDGESMNVSASRVEEGDTLQNVEVLDGIRHTAVEGNNYIDESRECSVSKDAESVKISASHVKKDDELQNVELLNGIIQTVVEGNNIDESGECSVSKDAESIKVSASHVKEDDKLQNVELLNGISQAAVEGNKNIGESRECSVIKDAETIKVSVSHGKESDKLQNVELLNGICQIDVDSNNNIDKGSDSSSEQFKKESSMAVRFIDEGRKESSQNHGIASMTKIEQDQDSSTRNVRVDGSSELRNSTPEPSPKVCEVVDGNGVAKSKCLYKIKPINDLCPAGVGEISISNMK